MLTLYRKALNAKTEKDILDVSSLIRNYYISNQNSIFKRNAPSFYYTRFPTAVTSLSILKMANRSEPIEHLLIRDTFYPLFIVLTIPNIAENQNDTKHYLSAITLYFFGNLHFLDQYFYNLGIKSSLIPSIKLASLSVLQSYAYMNMTKAVVPNKYNKILRVSSVIGLNFLSNYLHGLFLKHTNVFATDLLDAAVSFAVGPLSYKISTEGFSWISNELYRLFAKLTLRAPVVPEVPPDVRIPEQLQCLICRSLLRDPTLVGCNFYCKECINTWLSDSNLDPANGLPTSMRTARATPTMKHLCYQYYKLNIQPTLNNQN